MSGTEIKLNDLLAKQHVRIADLEAQLAEHEEAIEDWRQAKITESAKCAKLLCVAEDLRTELAEHEKYKKALLYIEHCNPNSGHVMIAVSLEALGKLPKPKQDPEPKEFCEWKLGSQFYSTKCGHNPKKTICAVNYCTYCGLEIKEVE